MRLTIKAMAYAKEKHRGQEDDNGYDYYKVHLLPVGRAVSQFTDDEEVIAAAYLHDVLEDTEVTYDELKEKFGARIADLVNEVTHEGSKNKYGFYFPRLKTADGILIKLCDRASNVSRMESWAKGRREQFLKRTQFWKDGSDKK